MAFFREGGSPEDDCECVTAYHDFMDAGTILQIIVTGLVAAGTALFVNARQERERVASFVDWKYVEHPHDGIHHFPYLGVHNRSLQPIAIHSVRWVVGGVFFNPHFEGTAIAFEDPLDLAFPYVVGPGEILSLVLDERAAQQHAASVNRLKAFLFRMIGKHRVLIEIRTTAQTRLLVPAEGALPWDQRIRSARL